jgi:hypothetical protein
MLALYYLEYVESVRRHLRATATMSYASSNRAPRPSRLRNLETYCPLPTATGQNPMALRRARARKDLRRTQRVLPESAYRPSLRGNVNLGPKLAQMGQIFWLFFRFQVRYPPLTHGSDRSYRCPRHRPRVAYVRRIKAGGPSTSLWIAPLHHRDFVSRPIVRHLVHEHANHQQAARVEVVRHARIVAIRQ